MVEKKILLTALVLIIAVLTMVFFWGIISAYGDVLHQWLNVPFEYWRNLYGSSISVTL